MTNAAEFSAAFPEPQTILGLRLLPLSLGRYRLLKRFECPFVDDEKKEIGIKELNKELFFSLVICALPCDEFCQLLNTGKLRKELKRWGKKLEKIVNKKGFSILESFAAFRRYLDDGSSVPWIVLSKQDNSETSMVHWSSSIEVTLRSKVGWTQKEIDENPLTKALADFFKYMESEGMVKLYDPAIYQDMQVEAKANGDAMENILQELDHGT